MTSFTVVLKCPTATRLVSLPTGAGSSACTDPRFWTYWARSASSSPNWYRCNSSCRSTARVSRMKGARHKALSGRIVPCFLERILFLALHHRGDYGSVQICLPLLSNSASDASLHRMSLPKLTYSPKLMEIPQDAQRDAHLAEVAPQAHSMLSLFLARDQKYLCPLETGGSESMLSNQFTDELNLVAHPVGSTPLDVRRVRSSRWCRRRWMRVRMRMSGRCSMRWM